MVEVSTDGQRGWRDITDVSLGVLCLTHRRDFYLSLRIYNCRCNKHLWERSGNVMLWLLNPMMLLFRFGWKGMEKKKVFVQGTGCTGNVLCDPFLQAFIFRQEVFLRWPVVSSRRGFLCYGFFFFLSLWLITTRASTDLDDLCKVIDCYRTLAESHFTRVQMTLGLHN